MKAGYELLNQIKRLCVVTNNVEWKKNRNMHAIRILDMLLNNRIESPYNQLIQGEVPLLSKTNVKSVLSEKIKNFEVPNHAEKIFGVKEMKIRGQSAGLKENKKLLKESIYFSFRIE